MPRVRGVLSLLLFMTMLFAVPLVASAAPHTVAQNMPATQVSPGVSASEQELTDGMVTISEVMSVRNGWIVIYRDRDGEPGEIIGQAWVSPGNNLDVSVNIDASMATETLYAVLHVDSGEMGVYEFPGPDTPVIVDEAAVSSAFMITNLGGEITIDVAPDVLPVTGADLTSSSGGSLIWGSVGGLFLLLLAGSFVLRRQRQI